MSDEKTKSAEQMEQEKDINSKELRLVVLGAIEAGKTSLITSLLGQTDTRAGLVRTVNSIGHHGQLSGRKLIVVDTPGWWNGYDLIDTAQRTKHELLSSVRECPPGPHAFILTIEVTSFKDRNLRTVREHLSLFGEHIWGHTALVFTKGESLKDRSIEQHIESEGEALQSLVEKCGNRYCVLDKLTTGQDQLLGVVERLVDSNRGRHFQLDDKALREVEEKKRDAQERARLRQDEVQEKRKHLLEQGVPHRLPEVRIVMLGWVVSGKSAARNVILNKDKLASLSKTEQCESETASVDGRHITVVDTPGWWKYFSAQYTPDRVKMALRNSVSFGCKSPNTLLLVVPADVSFLEEQRKITEDNMKMFGDHVWRHTIVLFTWGDSLGSTSIEEHIESEGEHLRWLVEKCGNRYHVFDNLKRGDGLQVQQLLEKIDELEANLEFGDLTQESPNTEITPSCEKEDTEKPDMLDKEWSRRDRELEERVRSLWQETFGSAVRGDKSFGLRPDFGENEESPDYGKVDLPQGNSSVAKHPSEQCQQHHGHQSNFNEEEIQKFQRELGRYKVLNVDRVRGILFRPTANAPGIQAEHERHRHGSRELEEWARHESVVMERVQTIISELCSKSVFTSEPDEEELNQSVDKVRRWKTGTSGLGSEPDLEEHDTSCAHEHTLSS